ncbi:MAG: phosphate transport system regulatory protein PhoU [Ignavibacteriaceae bacterium]|nr:MAG: phosphate signaling complex protein PhoU [Chlorobiota bacterium]GJQ32927.1 MAG: phosphate transport system regulatory protein PhoU [Ignavibacteriaceae bacterium]
MRHRIDEQLLKLRRRMIKMCSLVDEQVESAFRAIQDEDPDLAARVIELDEKVDLYDLKISRSCQKILAINQPVAIDLRMIMSSISINNNLERIGDIAVNLCENFRLNNHKPHFFERIKFIDMAQIVREMLRNSIDSFIRLDTNLAIQVLGTDRLLDRLNVENHRIMIDLMKEDPANIEEAVAYLVMCRQLERIGDHATNIAEDVLFIVQGETVKHNYNDVLGEINGDS